MMVRSLSSNEERQLFACIASRAAIEARRDLAWMRALRYSGCRVGEFSRLTVGSALMALTQGYLFLPRQIRKGGRRDHTVFVTAALAAALRDLLAVREEQTGDAAPPHDAPLVPNRQGEHLSVRSYQLRMEFWVAEAGLQVQATPHWFRHTRAIAIMRRSKAQDPRQIVQVALGHADISTSAIYTAPTREEVAQALEAADGAPRLRKRQAGRFYRNHYHPGGNR